MFDLNRAIKAKIENFSNDNIIKSEEKCNLASQILKKASDTKDFKLIADAIDLYFQAIQFYSRSSQAYIALAYIVSQFSQLEDSIKLLNKVLEIDPYNNHAKNMMKQLQQEIKSKHLSLILKKHSDKSLSELIKPSKKQKVDFFAKIAEIFVIKTKKSLSNKLIKDDFSDMIQQTRKDMTRL